MSLVDFHQTRLKALVELKSIGLGYHQATELLSKGKTTISLFDNKNNLLPSPLLPLLEKIATNAPTLKVSVSDKVDPVSGVYLKTLIELTLF